MTEAQEKWLVEMWDTTAPAAGVSEPLLSREYTRPASVDRALAALWPAHPAARLAWVTRLTWKSCRWSGELLKKVERPFKCPSCGSTNMDWSAEEAELMATCVRCGDEWNFPYDEKNGATTA